MSTPPVDLAKAHRWFAIELNNRAWDLIESPARTAEETTELLSIAHASRYHWGVAGTLLNRLRAELLVAAAYLASGKADLSLSYAERALALSDQPTVEATPFDRASASGAISCALRQLGDLARAKQYCQQALVEAARFEHPDDRDVFNRLYPIA